MKNDRSSSIKIDVKKVSKLANLSLTQDEEEEFDKQLNDIVGYIERLNIVDTANVPPTAQITGLKNRTRSDNPNGLGLSQDEAVSSSEKTHNGLFVVDKLVDTT